MTADYRTLVSIIIPTRNRKDLLPYALKSALNQTYQNIQIIVHDNHSIDGTEEAIKDLLTDDRIEYHRIDRDLSMTENWNQAVKYVQGSFFVRLDDDNVFFPEFLERSMNEMEDQHLDVMMFSPILIHPERRRYTFFDPREGKTHLLSPFQWAYLEFFALTDSNYALYRTALIKDIFPDGNMYLTSLPDRHMNYHCIKTMMAKSVRVGLNASIEGITRFDNQREKMTKLHYVNYADLDVNEIMQKIDCHHNYPMHRILTFFKVFSSTTPSEMTNFFYKTITSPPLLKTVMKMGHIYKLQRPASIKDAILYLYYFWFIFWGLLFHPFSRIEGQGVGVHVFTLIQKSMNYFLRSFAFPLDPKGSTNIVFGNRVIEDMLRGKSPSLEQARVLRGSLNHLLNHITQQTETI